MAIDGEVGQRKPEGRVGCPVTGDDKRHAKQWFFSLVAFPEKDVAQSTTAAESDQACSKLRRRSGSSSFSSDIPGSQP